MRWQASEVECRARCRGWSSRQSSGLAHRAFRPIWASERGRLSARSNERNRHVGRCDRYSGASRAMACLSFLIKSVYNTYYGSKARRGPSMRRSYRVGRLVRWRQFARHAPRINARRSRGALGTRMRSHIALRRPPISLAQPPPALLNLARPWSVKLSLARRWTAEPGSI